MSLKAWKEKVETPGLIVGLTPVFIQKDALGASCLRVVSLLDRVRQFGNMSTVNAENSIS